MLVLCLGLGCSLGGFRMDVSFVDRTTWDWVDLSLVGVPVSCHPPPSFWFAFLSSFGYNVVIPWAFSLLHMRITIAPSISCLFFVVLSADWTDIDFFFVPLNPPLHCYHTYELQRFKIRTFVPLLYSHVSRCRERGASCGSCLRPLPIPETLGAAEHDPHWGEFPFPMLP